MAIVKKTKNKKRARTSGFLARKNSPTGKNVLKRRMQKGRKKLVTV